MNYDKSTHCRFCGKEVSHHDGRILASGFVFCDTTCLYLYEKNMEVLNEIQESPP